MSTTLAWTIVSLSRERLSIPRRTRLVADAGAASEMIAARDRMQGKTRRSYGTATSTTRRIARCLEHPQGGPARGKWLRPVSHHRFGKNDAIRQGLARWANARGTLERRQSRAWTSSTSAHDFKTSQPDARPSLREQDL